MTPPTPPPPSAPSPTNSPTPPRAAGAASPSALAPWPPLPPPLTPAQTAALYFIEHRAKLLDLASFLDRAERGAGAGEDKTEPRLVMLRRALALLTDGKPERARRVLELLSDTTTEPIAAAGMKGATGVWVEAAKAADGARA